MRKVLIVLVLIGLVLVVLGYGWPGWWRTRPPEPAPESPAADAPRVRAETLSSAVESLKSGDAARGVAALEEICKGQKDEPVQARAARELADYRLSQGEEYEGYLKLSLAIRLWQGEGREALVQQAAPLAKKYLLSPDPTPNSVVHIVEPRDVIGKIAQQKKSSVGLILMANHLTHDRIHKGQALKVPLGPVALTVDKSDHRLTVFAAGCYLKDYRVGLGAHDQTPVAGFTIVTKIENPPWHKPQDLVLLP